ncbi:MAG TPA: hypothetical protein VGO22_01105 [Pseudorhizobium sp.]|jgi:hypothetical protein|nr:hypothetical protein [Pseudorhizobium sp.]
MISIPAVCPTCGAVYPSGIAVGEGSKNYFEGNRSMCPNGHWGNVPNGTYSVADGILRISRGAFGSISDLTKIRDLAQAVEDRKVEAPDALAEILRYLPPESSAAVEQLRLSPLAVVMFIFYLVTSILGAAGGLPGLVSTFKGDPNPGLTINNNITINNFGAAAKKGGRAIEGGNRHERRKAEKLGRKKNKVERRSKRKSGGKPETEI